MSSAMSIRNPTTTLDQSLNEALTLLRPGALDEPVEQALQALRAALVLAREELPPSQALDYTEAVCRHLRYGELMEARMLLSAARTLLKTTPA